MVGNFLPSAEAKVPLIGRCTPACILVAEDVFFLFFSHLSLHDRWSSSDEAG